MLQQNKIKVKEKSRIADCFFIYIYGFLTFFSYILFNFFFQQFPYFSTLINVFWIVATKGEQFCTSHDFSQMGNVARDALSPLLNNKPVQCCW